MLGFDSLTLSAWYRENRDFLQGARIQKIQQPDRRALILVLRKNGCSKKLYINIDTQFYHICFMSEKFEKLRELEIGKQPPMFCMLMRKYIEGALISDAKIFEGERIFELIIEKTDELSDRKNLILAVELMGKYSNIILYNADTKIIAGAAHNVGEEKSQERPIIGGLPYIYPKLQNKKFIEAVSFEEFLETIQRSDKKLSETISSAYHNITIFAAKYIAGKILDNYDTVRAFPTVKMQKLYYALVDYATLKNAVPMIDEVRNVYVLSSAESDKTRFESVNAMVDAYYAKNYSDWRINTAKERLIAKLNKDIAGYDKLNKKITESSKTDSEIAVIKNCADIIMCHIGENVFTSEKVILEDFLTGEKVKIEYDTSLSPADNAQLYYKKYAKAKKAAEMNNRLIKQNIEKKELLKDYIFSVKSAESYSELEEIKDEISGSDLSDKSKKAKCTVPSVVINDFVVYTGRNNKQNDFIYSKLSAPNDLWFHVLNQPGAHILIKVPKNVTVDNETLLECAKLAKTMSSAANSGKTSVIYTKRQFIKRPPNTQAGYVTFRNETEIVV